MPEILDSFLAGLSALPASYRVRQPRYAPVIGAALYAAMLAGTPLDDAARHALAQSSRTTMSSAVGACGPLAAGPGSTV
jgi:hypothetical protein